jgi:myo-inositol-1(or 4)-monophosphatase
VQFPNDGIIGEEHGSKAGDTGLTWIIDPIDGTSSYVSNMPGWCVVLACVDKERTVLGVICDPVADETWTATAGGGAYLNDSPTKVSSAQSLDQGSTAIGHNTRIDQNQTLKILDMLMHAGGKFYTSGSGALMLTYVASGRLLGYCEPHMNAWDCMAALLIIEEAGGIVQKGDHARMIHEGGRVIAGAPGVYNNLLSMSERAYGPVMT